MKKLKLNELNLDNDEVLTREQLKKVLGGMGSGGTGGGSGSVNCKNSCVKVNATEANESGTCKAVMDPIFNVEICMCSVVGGVGCEVGGS